MTIPALRLIDSIARRRAELRATPDALGRVERVQRWQIARLQRTYADYHADDRYRGALDFFIEDMYGPHDFRQRDDDLRKVMNTWYRLLPERALDAITGALELEALSQALDIDVAGALGTGSITESSYAAAYRQANGRQDRQRQISLILRAGRALLELVGRPWVQTALRMARRPARLAGVSALHEFLERGYAAFEKMTDAEDLLRVIERRETAIMQNLFEGAACPFDVASTDAPARRKA
jgi:hypothetical protein